MKKLVMITFVSWLSFLMMTGCGSRGKDESAESGKRITIAVIPKGTLGVFWKSVHAGAIKAARELDIDIIWKGPIKEDDREEQVQVVETFISSHVDAIVLAPLDDRALAMPVRDAKERGIPTVVIDSGLQGDFHESFVATDNYKGGVLAAERIGELTGGTGKLIMLRYLEGSASTTQREAGFLDTIRERFPGIEILSENQYSGATTDSAVRAAENLVNRFSDATVFFAPNDTSAFGLLRAIQNNGIDGKVILVGFDSLDKLIEAMEEGVVNGLVIQNPFKMGYLGVRYAYTILKGGTVEKRIDTGVIIATPDNMHDPDVWQLLSPDLSAYLDK